MLTNFSYFFNNTFVKKTHYPIISICLFIITVVLNSIQYANNENYLQDKLIVDIKIDSEGNQIPTPNVNNTLLFIYDMLGINGFINYTPAFIFFFIITYFFLSLIELNIGYAKLLFLLFIDLMFLTFWTLYQKSICYNNNRFRINFDKFPYCCGSFILFMALGFVMYLIQNNIKNIYSRILSIILLIGIYFLCLPLEIYSTYKDFEDGDEKNCSMFTWHGANYIFGVLCGLVLSN